MKENSLLYQIKTIEKHIARLFIQELNQKNFPSTPTQLEIMEYILNHPREVIHQKDLETILSLRRATVSGVLKTMEKNHLIERVVDTKDARQKKIILHEEVKKRFLGLIQKGKELENLMTKNITIEEKEKMIELLLKMQKNLKERKKEDV